MANEYVDVLIVGAGLSGIAAAHYLQQRCPKKSWTLIEARASIGGTWDLFRYPGVRSDSDMYTLGYRFRPWRGAKSIASGPAILQYIKDTARECGIDKNIRFQQRVQRIAWSSATARWTVDIQHADSAAVRQIECSFLFMCTGYYRYDKGYRPKWRGMQRFQGTLIHPQQWQPELSCRGQRVIVIGSGATAVTLVPALAEQAAHVTMLQRSPSYIVSSPSTDATALWLQRHLPAGLAAWLARWRMILRGIFYFHLARRKPHDTRRAILDGVREALGPEFDLDKHFAPAYDPWDQRVCLVPDADLFKAIQRGKVSMVTDHIATFVEDGIQLQSGQVLPADIIVTATGLMMQLMPGVQIVVDDQPLQLSDALSYKGLMYSSIPNLASAFGYTNASWTLKAELICEYVCRLLNYMERRGYDYCVPRPPSEPSETQAYIDFTSGYVQRALASLPKQGSRRPWKVYQNYLKDALLLRFSPLNDGVMEFKRRQNSASKSAAQ